MGSNMEFNFDGKLPGFPSKFLNPAQKPEPQHDTRRRFPEIEAMTVEEVRPRKKFHLKTRWGTIKKDVPCIDPRMASYLQPGMSVLVRYDQIDKNNLYIRSLGPSASPPNPVIPPPEPVVPIIIGMWTQSNSEFHQNALGDFIVNGLHLLSRTTQDWPLPTTTEENEVELGATAYGLAKAVHTGDDEPNISHWVTGWPVRESVDGEWTGWVDFAIGAWSVASRNLLWRVDWEEQATWPLTRQNRNTAKFFYDQTTRWAHLIPDEGNEPKIYSAKSETEHSFSTLDKPARHASPVAGRMILPWVNLAYTSTVRNNEDFILSDLQIVQTGLYDRAEIYNQDLSSNGDKEWHKIAEPYLPDIAPWAEDFERRILLRDWDSYHNGPAPYSRIRGAWLRWVSGRQSLRASDDQEQILGFNFSAQPLGPGSGPSTPITTNHANYGRQVGWAIQLINRNGNQEVLAYQNIEAPEAPRKLTGSCLDSEALAAGPLVSGLHGSFPAFHWINNTLEVADQHHQYQSEPSRSYGDSPGRIHRSPAQLPDFAYFRFAAPLLLPAPTPNRRRVHFLTECLHSAWPANLHNNPGGIVIDEDGTENITDPELGTTRYGYAAVLVPESILYGGERTDTPYAFSTRLAPRYVGMVAVYQGGSFVGEFERYQPMWINRLGYLWRTKILRIDLETGETTETDITQELDGVTHSEAFIGSGFDDGIPIGTNVWQMIAVPQKDLLLVLRDRFPDYESTVKSGSPVPFLEIYRTNESPMGFVGRHELGSDDLLGTDFDSNRLTGDRLWNAYAFGGPRMKAVLRTIEEALDVRVNVMVAEQKQLENVETESGFTRIHYYSFNLDDPADPEIEHDVYTSPDVGAGNSTVPIVDSPLWGDWDTLVMAGGSMAWSKSSKFYETV